MDNADLKKLILAGYEKLRNGQVKELSEMYAEDAIWSSPRVDAVPFSGSQHGREAILRCLEAMMREQEAKQVQINALILDSGRAAVCGHSVWLVKATNKIYETDWVHIIEYDDHGKGRRFQMAFDTAAMSSAFKPGKSESSRLA